MHHKLRLLYPFLYLFLVGCSLTPKELKLAEKSLKDKPDSALVILQRIPLKTLSDENRALYGILLFQALDKTNKTLQPDSVINYSVNYYQQNGDNNKLAISYYYKARLFKKAQRFDEATGLYLKALDIFQNHENNYFLGKTYSDIGDICSLQKDYKESLAKYNIALAYFKKTNDTLQASYKLIDIGRVYRFLKLNSKALENYKKAISQMKDSSLCGLAFQEMGINYFKSKKNDLAEYYLKKSLRFPYKGTSYAIRCSFLGDVYLEKNQYDSAVNYATLALNYPTTFFIQRECYRILANTEYMRGDLKKMGVYMTRYQDCTDSVRQIEIQTKSTVLENIHETKGAVVKSNYFSLMLTLVILFILSLSYFIFKRLRTKNKKKENELKTAEIKLTQKQSLLKESLLKKIEENKRLKTVVYKKSTLKERELIDKEIYTFCLHLDDWTAFEKLMNQTFNNLFLALREKNSEINRKELILCSLILLDIPTSDIIIILDCQQDSLYKLKHRLSQKLKLSGAKELNQLLQKLSTDN